MGTAKNKERTRDQARAIRERVRHQAQQKAGVLLLKLKQRAACQAAAKRKSMKEQAKLIAKKIRKRACQRAAEIREKAKMDAAAETQRKREAESQLEAETQSKRERFALCPALEIKTTRVPLSHISAQVLGIRQPCSDTQVSNGQ